ncbi:MAG TPA: VTT domain-containing protein [Kofleriaceae bacterium]|nr:VTT domain-containing protein [Kofleriaceae bacterium]
MRASGTAIRVGIGAAVVAALVLAGVLLPLGAWIEALVRWTRHEGLLGLTGFALVFILCTLTMLPTLELYIGAGLVYGTWWGAALMTALSLVAALLAYAIARTSLRKWIERRLAHHEKIEALDKGIGEHAFWLGTLLRLAPVLPFGPTNYALGATRISRSMYALTVIVGTAPTNVMYAYAGSLLHRVTELSSAHTGNPLLLWGGIAATVAATVLLGWIAKHALDRAAKR